LKRILLSIAVALFLTVVCGGAALATPLVPGEAGQFVVFGTYDEFYEEFLIGAGYGISDGVTLGGFYGLDYQDFGIFANLALGPILVNGEVCFDDNYIFGKVSALYAFDLDGILLGVGGGSDFGPWGNEFFVELAGNVSLGENIAVYAAYNYYLDGGQGCYKAGLSFAF
jgi:hypothetical protein